MEYFVYYEIETKFETFPSGLPANMARLSITCWPKKYLYLLDFSFRMYWNVMGESLLISHACHLTWHTFHRVGPEEKNVSSVLSLLSVGQSHLKYLHTCVATKYEIFILFPTPQFFHIVSHFIFRFIFFDWNPFLKKWSKQNHIDPISNFAQNIVVVQFSRIYFWYG